MNPAHIHLWLNHVPTVGFGAALAVFAAARVRRDDGLTRASLVLFFLVAVLSIASFLSGHAAEPLVQDRPGVEALAIRAHEDAALFAFALVELTGLLSWLALWRWRRVPRLSPAQHLSLALVAVLTFAATARTANLGGDIRHPEIRAAADADGGRVAAAGTARSIGLFVSSRRWVWPTAETLHFVGLSFLFTVVLIVDLRLLGMAKPIPYAALHQLLPVGMAGFGLNLATGLLFYLGATPQYVHNKAFYWKIVFVVLGGVNLLYFMLADEVWAVGSGDDAPLSSKAAAASAIALWAAVLYCGHMLPFIGNAF